MAWGGAEEQQKAVEEGNPNAKDWCDEACQIIEDTMQEYWDDKPTPQANMLQTATAVADEGNHATTLASEYDHHHRALIEKTATTHADCGGWKHELRSYFSSIPADVSKDTDIIEWWSVSCPQCLGCLIVHLCRLIQMPILRYQELH